MAIIKSKTTTFSGDYQIDPLLGYSQWNTTTITYSFLSGGYAYGEPVSESIKNNVRNIIENYIEPFINVNFVEVADSDYDQLCYMFSNEVSYAAAYPPGDELENGNVYLNPYFDDSTFNGFQGGPGTYGFMALIHETLHALGLQHPNDYNGGGGRSSPYLPFGEDNNTNTVMSYNFAGSSVATLMPYDLKALQHLYGAKSYNALDTNYSFDSVYGYSDGSRYWGSATSPMKLTIWDSGGTDTLNFSSLAFDIEGYRFDLKEGGILTSQFAYNGTPYDHFDDMSGTTYYTSTFGTAIAYGAIIENAIGSSSNDTIIGNSSNNSLSGNDGNDFLYGKQGNDTLLGGAGADRIVGGGGNDILTGAAGADRFFRKYSTTAIDTITDFQVGVDLLAFSASGFGGGLAGRALLDETQFTIGSAAADSSDRFIYNSATGGLFFDADGIGGAAQVQIFTLSSGLAMTHADVFIFA